VVVKGKPNSLDIAHLAGVSQATVSRALRGHPSVNRATRDRVLEVARQLNYKVDKNASNLRTQQSGTLALLLFEDPTVDDSNINPFFHSMLGSITRVCAQRGYDLLVSFQQLSRDWHADYEDCHKADGLILLGYGDYRDYRGRLEALVAQGTHFVRWGAVLADQPGLSIGCDNHAGGLAAARHLLALGRRRIGFLGHASQGAPEFLERYQGYAAALREAALTPDPLLQADAISTEQAGREAAELVLERGARLDALVCASDLIAIGAMRALRARGLRVPEDVAIVGYDDIPMAQFTNPALSSVQQDTRRAGELLVDTLLKLVHGEPAQPLKLAPQLIVRQSCGMPLQPTRSPATVTALPTRARRASRGARH
jgi:DNA-binding LacI/PurR family transcriptional regulator